MIEGARAYADHGRTSADMSTRSVRDIVGFYKDAAYIPPETSPGGRLKGDGGRIDATLHIMEAADWLRSLVKEAISLGKPDLIGLSIDIFGNWEKVNEAKKITSVLSLNSCDIVTRPSAGGSLQRILHSEQSEQGDPMEQQTTTTVQDPPENQNPSATSDAINRAPTQQTGQITEEQRLLEAQRAMMAQALDEIKREKCALTLDRRLMESQFPAAIQTQIRAQYAGHVFEDSQLENTLSSYRTMLAELTQAGLIRGQGYEKPGSLSGMISEAEKVQAAFDKMFELEIDTTRLGNIRAFGSIREAYARVTGDASVAGFSDRSKRWATFRFPRPRPSYASRKPILQPPRSLTCWVPR